MSLFKPYKVLLDETAEFNVNEDGDIPEGEEGPLKQIENLFEKLDASIRNRRIKMHLVVTDMGSAELTHE